MYRTIETSFWTDPKVKTLNTQARLLLLYCITNNHTHASGIYSLPNIIAAHESGLPLRGIDTLWDTLSGAGLVKRDAEIEVVWVVNMFRYQGSGEKMVASASHHLMTLHKSFLCKEFADKYPSVLSVKGGYRIDTPSIPHPAQGLQEQKQEQEQKQKTRDIRRVSPDLPPGFVRFWKIYPDVDRKTDRAKCAKKWAQLGLESIADEIVSSVELWKKSKQWTKNGGEFIPMPMTFLNGRRWETKPEPATADDQIAGLDAPPRKVDAEIMALIKGVA